MKCNNLEMLIRHIYFGIMKDEYDRMLQIHYGENEILIFVFEPEIPIRVRFEDVLTENGIKNMLIAEVYTELCRGNIGTGWLAELDQICRAIEENEHIFRILLEKGAKCND